MLIAKLLVVGGEVKTTEIKLRLPCVIGRGKGATVTLPHPLVSRQHCELFEANGRLWVRDLGSLNGTYVNNEKVTETELPPNELLTIGAVTFRAMYEVLLDTTAENPPTARMATGRQELPHESTPTVKVDARKQSPIPVQDDNAEHQAGNDDVGFHADDDDAQMPSTPLFSEDNVPAPRPTTQPPAAIVPPRGVMPAVAIPQAVVPPLVPPTATSTAAENAMEDSGPLKFATNDSLDDRAEPEIAASEDDDDLNDFLNNLGKK